jgi:small subunit ribosomal protein S18
MSEEIKNTETVESADSTEIAASTESTDSSADSSVAESAQTTTYYEKKPYISQDEGGDKLYQRNLRFKRKVCRFCHDKNARIDYKDVKMVEQFITDRGKILPRRVTGICAKHQRGVALAIKRARIIALIPFVEK